MANQNLEVLKNQAKDSVDMAIISFKKYNPEMSDSDILCRMVIITENLYSAINEMCSTTSAEGIHDACYMAYLQKSYAKKLWKDNMK